ncbi:uncharacterized protein LOC119729070 [Patiria miniata]|uniref:MAM domain-containing protein n=1 Tax=Patiria miniata TaxID=46514 RepID=A0A914A0U5_PATMI|nr:uncharacterized protein LOC119729070 [Patiria miniata]
MDLRKAEELSIIDCCSGGLSLRCLVCLLIYSASHATFAAAASTGVETFEGSGTGLPPFQCGNSGWSIQQTSEGNLAFVTCPSKCSHNVTVLRGSFTNFGTATVSFNYALNVGDATSLQASPVLSVYCESRSVVRLWTSLQGGAANGSWQHAEVKVKPPGRTFNLIFEANIQEIGQVIGLDNVVVQDGKNKVPPAPTIPLAYPANCLEDGRPTYIPTDGDQSTSQSTDETTPYPSDVSPENTFGLLDNETTLLFAQILAILSVCVCFITVGIHCLIWRKQRRLHKISSVVHLRPKATSDVPHDSMLLEMNLVASDQPDQPTSNSLCEPTKTKCLQQLKESDILQKQDPRRATIAHGASGSMAHHMAKDGSEDDDSDDEQQLPHPRTKSLPCRPPVNVYESIDEVGKYQPLTFGKRPAPGPPAPVLPKGRKLHTRARGVQNLAAVRKYRPSSVQYEEIGNRKNGLLIEEPRDRSKSASHYDYVKRKSVQQSPRRNGSKHGQAPRPKGRAPAPPTRLYDEPVRKSRPVVKVDSAPTLLLQNQESSAGESLQTDYENTLEKPKVVYDRPTTISEETEAKPPGDCQYFTLEPPAMGRYATSEDSDDEHESERDISRFEDAEETDPVPNGTASIALRPLSASVPIDIPSPKAQTMADFDVESSCL